MRKWKNNERIVILDLEYTNLKAKVSQYNLAHEVLQIGAVMLNNQYEIIDKFNALVRPSFSIESYNARKDKIMNSSDRSVLIRGRFGSVYKAFCEWIGVTPVDVLVWGEQDYLILNREFEAKYQGEDKKALGKYMSKFIDMQRVLMRMLDAENMPSLDFALNLVKEKFIGKRHNAYADAENTARVFAKLHRQKRFEFNANYIADEINPDANVPKYEKATIAELASIDFTPTETEEARSKTKKTIEYGANKKDASMLSITSFLTPGIKGEHKFVEKLHHFIGRSPFDAASCSSGDFDDYEIKVANSNIPTFRSYIYTLFNRLSISNPESSEIYMPSDNYDIKLYIKISSANFACKNIDQITTSDISTFCKYVIKTNQTESASKILNMFRCFIKKAVEDGFLDEEIIIVIDNYQLKNQERETYQDALLRLFSADWKNTRCKAIAEAILLTGYPLKYFRALNTENAEKLACELKKSNWLNECICGYALSFNEYLETPNVANTEFIFGDDPDDFPSERKLNKIICNMTKNLDIKYHIDIPALIEFGASHTKLPYNFPI